MKKRYYMMALLMSVVTMGAMAKPRAMKDMKRVAQQELAQTQVGVAMAKAKKSVKLLDDRQTVAVFGYEDGGFVVMATDDMYPEVLGSSETRYNPNTDNENFRWWLDAMRKVTGVKRNQPLKLVKPDTDKYPAYVKPFVETKWDQDSPFNDQCPSGCPTGCVATAMAQVIKYNEWPLTGTGTVYTYVPFGDFDGHKYEVNIEGAAYDYGKMLNSYYGGATRAQKAAVAKLMYHVGLAMRAMYESTGTGAYNETLAHGARLNLGYPYAVTVNRDDYTEEEWMDMIYRMLSNQLPIVYGGADETYMGHEFVLHGYNQNGRIYINWGWGGSEDGYFDLALLKVYWGVYDFTLYQDMLLRVDPLKLTTEMVEVTVDNPGTLADILTQEQQDSVVWLKVNGKINGSDLRTIRRMAGSDENAHGTWGNLSVLDLSEAAIVAGGESYLFDEEEGELVTADNEMPYKAFYKCSYLIDVRLPRNLAKYGDGVFAECNNLDRVELIPCDASNFVVLDNQVLSSDLTEMIEQLPSEEVGLTIPDGVSVVHPYAFAARYLYQRLTIPESVTQIGAYAFNRCFDLTRTYLFATEPPQIDPSAIDDLDISLRSLYVPTGTKAAYKQALGWKKYSRIVEFDTGTVGVEEMTTAIPSAEGDVYAIDGRLVRKATDTHPLSPGFYIMGKRKLIVR